MKKIKVLALVLVFAFAALGGAYAMWYDDLVIDETVNTGVLDLQWNGVTQPDEQVFPNAAYEYLPEGVYGVGENNDGLDELDPGNENTAKNIGYLNARIINDGNGDVESDNDKLEITLGNGYPGYQDRIFTSIENLGTVPAKFDITSANIPDWLIVEIWYDVEELASKDTSAAFDYMIWSNKNTPGQIKLQGYQIDPGEVIPVAIYTRVLQTAPQDTQVNFTINLKAIQWNEFDFDLPNTIQTIDRVDPYFDGNGQDKEPKFAPVVPVVPASNV